MTASPSKQPLRSHPANPPPPGFRIEVQRLPSDDPARPLRLRFDLDGELAILRLIGPLAAAGSGPSPGRTDGLWRHTCFEAFVAGDAGTSAYVEYNFAPTGAWAIYRFDAYREGQRAEPVTVEPRIVARRSAGTLRLDVAVAWPAPLPGLAVAADAGGPWRGRLGLTAVLEAADGSLSYWALHHPAARADFHNDGGFTLGVEVPA